MQAVSARSRTWLLAAIPVGLAALLVGPDVLRGAIPWFMDVVAQFYPIRHFAARTLHQGLLPLWIPTYYTGVPLLANPQWGVLYPPNWLFFLFPTGHTFMALYLLHQILLALGGLWMARAVLRAPLAALGVALVLGFGGWTWAHFPFGSYLAAACWTPWVLGCLERHSREPRARWVITAGALWALQVLAGAPQVVFLCSLAHGVWALMLALAPTPMTRRSLAPLALLAGALGIALLLSAGQWLPTVDLMRHTARGAGLSLDEVAQGTLGLSGGRSLVRALIGGNVFDPGQGEDAESTAHVGLLGVVIAALGLLLLRWRGREEEPSPQVRSLPLRAAVLLLLALLWSWSGASASLHRHFPGYALFHDPKRALVIAHIALALLIGAGVEWIDQRERGRWGAFPPRRLALLALLLALAALRGAAHVGDVRLAGLVAVLSVSGLAVGLRGRAVLATLALTLLTFDLLAFRQQRIDTRAIPAAALTSAVGLESLLATLGSGSAASGEGPRTPSAGFARLPARVAGNDFSPAYSYDFRRPCWPLWMLPNQPTLFGLLDAQGFDPTIPTRARAFFDLMNEGYVTLYPRQFCLIRAWESPLVDLLAVRWILGAPPGFPLREFEGRERAPSPVGLRRFGGRSGAGLDLPAPLTVTENLSAESRLVHRTRFLAVPGPREARETLRELGARVREVVVLELPLAPPGESALAAAASGEALRIHGFSESPNAVTADLEAARGWMILRDQIFPGWRAWVDGVERPLFPADLLFRGVEWPGGRHTLRLAYEPTAVRLGLFLSLVALASISVTVPSVRFGAHAGGAGRRP